MILLSRGNFGTRRSRSNISLTFNDSMSETSSEEEDAEIPEDLADLSPEEQQDRVKKRAAWLCGLGTVLLLVFSDPSVDVLNEMGNQLGVPNFYVAFVLAPMASNLSEVIAAYNYSQRKTKKTMNVSLSTLLGAACMNNTFCMGIFLVLMGINHIGWKFTSECITLVVVEFILGVYSWKKVHRVADAWFVLSLYPLSLVAVYVLKNVFGFV